MVDSNKRSASFDNLSIPDAYQKFLVPSLFTPWAQNLLNFISIKKGSSVLDVASGTGIVAKLAVKKVETSGYVIASDISKSMLDIAKNVIANDKVQYIVCPADAINLQDDFVDVVLCQFGIQFFSDKKSAIYEMRRVLKEDGIIGLSVWASEKPFGFYGQMIDAIAPIIPEPFPKAYDSQSYCMSKAEIEVLLHNAGFKDIQVELQELVCTWNGKNEIIATISATPYGPPYAKLSQIKQKKIQQDFIKKLQTTENGQIICKTYAYLAKAKK